MDDDGATTGTTRRDLIKKSIVAGGLVWMAPVVSSGTAWADFVQDNCACNNGLTVYTKYSGKSTNSGATPTMNQCLDPVPGVVGVPITCLIANGLVSVGSVTNADRQASLVFDNSVFLMKTAIKSTNDCYYGFCATPTGKLNTPPDNTTTPDGFVHQYYANGSGSSPHEPGTAVNPSTPIFSYDQLGGTPCGSPGTTPCTQVHDVLYDTSSIAGASGGDPLNYIELLLCLPGTSKPPTC